jgi:hypothetical protein
MLCARFGSTRLQQASFVFPSLVFSLIQSQTLSFQVRAFLEYVKVCLLNFYQSRLRPTIRLTETVSFSLPPSVHLHRLSERYGYYDIGIGLRAVSNGTRRRDCGFRPGSNVAH